MKKRVTQITALLLAVGMLVGCGKGSTVSSNSTLNPEDFEGTENFITIVDCPPNPLDEKGMELYTGLGVNTFVLTEDYTPMVGDEGLGETYKESIKTLGQKGLNVWIRNMWNDPDYFDLEQAKTGSSYGTPYTMEPRKITTEFSEFSEVKGFYMADELFMVTKEDNPATEDNESLHCAMDQMDKLVEWKNTYYPDAYWHINHVPSTSYDHWPSGESYATFVQHYIDTILKKLTSGGRSICFDNYPLTGAGKISDSYILDVVTFANAARDYNATAEEGQKADFGICLQTFMNTNPGFELRDITSAADITFQMYTGMAAGAHLFEYFCWRSYDSFGMYGMVDETGEKRVYDYVKEANERALPFEKVVLSFDWKGLTAKKGDMSGKDDTFGDVKDLLIQDTGSLSSISSRYDTIVGCFEKDGQDGFMVVNYTEPILDMTNAVTLTFKNCSQVLVYTEEGTEVKNLTEEGQLRLTLDAGQGAFVIPK